MVRILVMLTATLFIFGCKKENKNTTTIPSTNPIPVVVDSGKLYDRIDTFKGTTTEHYENYAAGYVTKDTTYNCQFIIKHKDNHIDISAKITDVDNMTSYIPGYKNEVIDMGFGVNASGHYVTSVGVKDQNYYFTFAGTDSLYFTKSTFALCGDVSENVNFSGRR